MKEETRECYNYSMFRCEYKGTEAINMFELFKKTFYALRWLYKCIGVHACVCAHFYYIAAPTVGK